MKDTKDKDGNVTATTAKMLTTIKGKSHLGTLVTIKLCQQFTNEESWQKIDELRTKRTLPTEQQDNTGGGDNTNNNDGGELEP